MLELAIFLIIIGLALVLLSAFVPAPPALVSIGWALFVLGAVILIVVLLLDGLDIELDGNGNRGAN